MGPTDQVLPVSAVVSFLREYVEASELLSDLWITGEVSNYSQSQLGHRYFTLRDAKAAIRCVMFRDRMPRGFQLQDGDRIIAHGRITVYVQRGELQFDCDFARPEGVGALAAKLEELRLRLEAEGLFDPARKRPLPRFPMRIGLVTSPGGAALHDVQFVLRKRWPLATLVFAPAMVQGELAPGQVVAALRRLAAEPDLDVILVVRGGGASEDLHAFNDERVARAIYASPYPVVTGVGHETDVTIADLVADVRAATPSAAAERATPDIVAVRRNLEVLDRAMASAVRQTAAGLAADVEAAAARLRRSAPRVAELQGAVRELAQGMEGCIERQLQRERGRFETMAARLAALDPMATLRRGFAIVQREGGRQPVVSSVRGVRAGDRLRVAVSDGAFWTEVR
ncbi:MAG: exodeoxyribonuclease 7 large subunit [Tepidiforma sp.]|jgi:exodeoxyribonuclease VII large subunit|uniref:exodeoxyribonuclease VII large subunit n=1 Tax=Tepidiforma sp. TaxID=2682230 RepID=UPI0021DDDBDE|nr:exodeoxyribonuclease VII large subunit [Tepidiforma sp.]GIW15047.1 MAG: exodeoxyribonuclease 7 large subunit [Tepidiforma sp.]